MNEFLRMEQITKKFGDVYANRNIHFDVRQGEVHTLLGENGAGKSTLMNILIGLYEPTSGNIHFQGKITKIDSPSKAVKLGVGMVHQHFMLIEAMTVFENIILGITKDKSKIIRKDRMKKEILALAERYGLDIEIDQPISDISVGAQQRVEILKALYRGAELLILDEPTAALTDIEVEGLFQIIRKLTQENKSVVFISHKMREVLEISDRITILRAGETVVTLDKDNTHAEELANLMIGKELVPTAYEKIEQVDKVAISLNNISYNKHSKHSGLKNIHLEIGHGEIVGIAGVDGNGQSQLAGILTGNIRPHEGTMEIKSQKIKKFTPKAFMNHNISHIPEDRNKMGLIGNMTVKENLLLKQLHSQTLSHGKGWMLRRKNMVDEAKRLKEQYDIRCASIEQESRNLSGGNQQKIILARELEENPHVLVAVHPTRGLDIGATRYVHDSMIASREQGCGVLLISADFDEVLKLSDRIVVMFEGQIVGTYSGINPPIREISMAMSGKI